MHLCKSNGLPIDLVNELRRLKPERLVGESDNAYRDRFGHWQLMVENHQRRYKEASRAILLQHTESKAFHGPSWRPPKAT